MPFVYTAPMRAPPLIPLAVVCFALGCDEPKKPVEPAPAASQPTAVASVAPTPSAPAAASAAASASAAPASDSDGAVPPLVGADGKPLPQTEDKPSLRSKSWEKRVALLFRAIQIDDPSVAMPAFFPVIAYEQVKALPKPAVDWKQRLVKAFERDIHEAHKKMGEGAGSAQLVGLEVPEPKAQWMKPGSEGNKLGYFRVLGSKLRYLDGGGSPKAIDVTSLISWRGEWYVVHLHGFK